MTAVHARAPEHRAIAQQLPQSLRLSDAVDGAIAVLEGTGSWWDAARTAQRCGAIAVVIADPRGAPQEPLELGIPVLVDRPRLHAHAIADAVADPGVAVGAALVVDVVAPEPQLLAATRDGIGWLRVLSGRRPQLLDLVASTHAAAATLDAGDRPATIVIAASEAPLVIEVIAVASERLRVRVGDVAGGIVVARDDADGTRIRPPRHEASLRATLRRAVRAADGGELPDDLAVLVDDHDLAVRILSARSPRTHP